MDSLFSLVADTDDESSSMDETEDTFQDDLQSAKEANVQLGLVSALAPARTVTQTVSKAKMVLEMLRMVSDDAFGVTAANLGRVRVQLAVSGRILDSQHDVKYRKQFNDIKRQNKLAEIAVDAQLRELAKSPYIAKVTDTTTAVSIDDDQNAVVVIDDDSVQYIRTRLQAGDQVELVGFYVGDVTGNDAKVLDLDDYFRHLQNVRAGDKVAVYRGLSKEPLRGVVSDKDEVSMVVQVVDSTVVKVDLRSLRRTLASDAMIFEEKQMGDGVFVKVFEGDRVLLRQRNNGENSMTTKRAFEKMTSVFATLPQLLEGNDAVTVTDFRGLESMTARDFRLPPFWCFNLPAQDHAFVSKLIEGAAAASIETSPIDPKAKKNNKGRRGKKIVGGNSDYRKTLAQLLQKLTLPTSDGVPPQDEPILENCKPLKNERRAAIRDAVQTAVVKKSSAAGWLYYTDHSDGFACLQLLDNGACRVKALPEKTCRREWNKRSEYRVLQNQKPYLDELTSLQKNGLPEVVRSTSVEVTSRVITVVESAINYVPRTPHNTLAVKYERASSSLEDDDIAEILVASYDDTVSARPPESASAVDAPTARDPDAALYSDILESVVRKMGRAPLGPEAKDEVLSKARAYCNIETTRIKVQNQVRYVKARREELMKRAGKYGQEYNRIEERLIRGLEDKLMSQLRQEATIVITLLLGGDPDGEKDLVRKWRSVLSADGVAAIAQKNDSDDSDKPRPGLWHRFRPKQPWNPEVARTIIMHGPRGNKAPAVWSSTETRVSSKKDDSKGAVSQARVEWVKASSGSSAAPGDFSKDILEFCRANSPLFSADAFLAFAASKRKSKPFPIDDPLLRAVLHGKVSTKFDIEQLVIVIKRNSYRALTEKFSQSEVADLREHVIRGGAAMDRVDELVLRHVDDQDSLGMQVAKYIVNKTMSSFPSSVRSWIMEIASETLAYSQDDPGLKGRVGDVRDRDKQRKIQFYESLSEQDRIFFQEYRKIVKELEWNKLEERFGDRESSAESAEMAVAPDAETEAGYLMPMQQNNDDFDDEAWQ